jgi:outer membrane protein insertion porin family
MLRVLCAAVALASALPPAHAQSEHASDSEPAGERVARIRVLETSKTDPEIVQLIAGVNEGDLIRHADLETMRDRLLASGLFRDVEVTSAPAAHGVTVRITARDRISWFVAPTFSYSQNAYGVGLAAGETNLLGWHKKALLVGTLSNTTGSVNLAYFDPSVRGTWVYYQIDGGFQRDRVYEYAPHDLPELGIERTTIVRSTNLDLGGGTATVGVRWWRKLKTEGRLSVRRIRYYEAQYPDDSFQPDEPLLEMRRRAPMGAGTSGTNFAGRALAGWDSRGSIYGVQRGLALLGSFEGGLRPLGSDFGYFKAWLGYHQALRFFREHNLILRATGQMARNEPFFEEFESGGAGFRGYLTREFRGDTRVFGSTEYQFPLVKIAPLGFHLRGLVFADSDLSFFSQKASCGDGRAGSAPCSDGYPYAERRSPDGHIRYYLPGQEFRLTRNAWHNGVGAGLRFCVEKIAMPLVGVDYGYGIEQRLHQFYVTVGGAL